MNVQNKKYLTVWMEEGQLCMIHQNKLPWSFEIHRCHTFQESCQAIKDMIVRGAGAIGAAAGYAMAQAWMQAPNNHRNAFALEAKKQIEATRPTARNLFYAVEKVFQAGFISLEKAISTAQEIAEKDIDDSRRIGVFGQDLFAQKTHVLTHCNAGWLAFVDYGTALSPIYSARDQQKEVFVYVSETRPRAQGARLTAWELSNEKIPHIIIPDSAAAALMAQGKVDLIITGADRIARNGDVANKIGTLDRAILAKYYNIPFYVAAPLSTFDADCPTGDEIVIEERDPEEVLYQEGPTKDGVIAQIRVAALDSTAFNPAFDVTPAHLITGIVTEKGIIQPQTADLEKLFKESDKILP